MTSSSSEGASRREVLLLVVAFGLLALLRLLTVARDPWEWDEILFLQGARDGLDVRLHHPHPPGYPGFVYPARLLVACGAPPFGAVTAAGLLGGLLAVAGVFFLLRAFGTERPFAALGAAAYGLIPAVWLHSVRPLTDATGAAVFLFAAAFLVRAIREGGGGDLVAAAALSGWSAAVRPQQGMALLPAALVAAGAVWRSRRRAAPLAAACAAGVLVSALFWAPAIRSSGGITSYRERLSEQVAFVAANEAPHLADLTGSRFWKRWWYDPFGSSDAAFVFLLVALASFALARRRALLALALFLPVTVATMGFLGRIAAPRYALALLPLPAMLAAFTAERLAGTRAGRAVVPAGALLLAGMALPAIPAIVEVHERPSPTVAVVEAARAFPARKIWFHGGLLVHAGQLLRGRASGELPDDAPAAPPPGDVFAWVDGAPIGQTPVASFGYANRELLERISRGRYLSAGLYDPARGASVPAPSVAGDGWWDERRGVAHLRAPGAAFAVRSVGATARVSFLAEASGPARLRVTAAGETRLLALGAGEQPIALVARSDAGAPRLSIALEEGSVRLREFRIDVSGPRP